MNNPIMPVLLFVAIVLCPFAVDTEIVAVSASEPDGSGTVGDVTFVLADLKPHLRTASDDLS